MKSGDSVPPGYRKRVDRSRREAAAVKNRHEDDDDFRPFQGPTEQEDDDLGNDQELNRSDV